MRQFNKCIPLVTGAALLMGTVGCEQLPGRKEHQGAVIGGAAGAAVGAAVAENNLLGALIGGLIGAGGGYLIGANIDKIRGRDTSARSRPTLGRKTILPRQNRRGMRALPTLIAMVSSRWMKSSRWKKLVCSIAKSWSVSKPAARSLN